MEKIKKDLYSKISIVASLILGLGVWLIQNKVFLSSEILNRTIAFLFVGLFIIGIFRAIYSAVKEKTWAYFIVPLITLLGFVLYILKLLLVLRAYGLI